MYILACLTSHKSFTKASPRLWHSATINDRRCSSDPSMVAKESCRQWQPQKLSMTSLFNFIVKLTSSILTLMHPDSVSWVSFVQPSDIALTVSFVMR